MMLTGSKCVASYDPRTGSRHWIIDGPTEQFVASVVYDGRLLFLTGGYPELHILAVRPNGQGNVTDSHVAWRTTEGAAYVPSPIVVGQHLLLVSDNGIASCFETGSGRRLWKQRLRTHYSASPIAAGGLVYFVADDGTTTVVKPGPKFESVAENPLGENCYASPAVSRRQVFLRGEKHLVALGTASN
jgi:outer membrane protein assembly factor BamB